MSDAVAAAPSPGHELLLGLAGWVDDDLLAIGRELVAVGEEAGALELLVASLAADRTVLPHPVRAGLADAVERRIGGDLARLLPPGAPLPDRTAHVFAADAGDLESTTRIGEVVAGLAAVARSGARTAVTWRLTPAGAAPGPLPHPVVLLVLDDPAPAEVLTYQVGAALARAGVTASVEAFADGAVLPPYQRAALAAAGASLGTASAGAPGGDRPPLAPPSATATGPHERDTPDPLTTDVHPVPDDPSWSGPYAAVPTPDTPPADTPRADTPRADERGRSHARADEPGADRSGVDGSAPEPTGTAPGRSRGDHGAPSAEEAGPARPTGTASVVEDTGRTQAAAVSGAASSTDGTGNAGDIGRTPAPVATAGAEPPAPGAGAAPSAEGTATAPTPDVAGSAPPAGSTGVASAAESTGSAAEAGSAPHPATSATQAGGPAGVDPARFDPARNAVDRTVLGGSRVNPRPEVGADPEDGPVDVATHGDPRPGAGAGEPDVRPGPAPDADPDAGPNGHPSPRPAPHRVPRPAPQDGPPSNGHPSPDGGSHEREWARQWSNGSWSMPSGPPGPGRDPDIEPATSPTPTTPPLSRVPPSPTRRASGAGEPEPEAYDIADPRARHRLDTPGAVPPVPTGEGRDDVLDSRLTPNEQELLRRLQQELAAREGGSAEPPSSQRNGTSHPSEQD